ncbi:MAG TPA: beta-ketoacyl-[acyl-carrier-protein] synthase family protein [Bauldia sp.]|nr:beta-ketoacyl-[acyl-carrier-protein] synthase family protein [Bauldia sp.]
MNGGRRVVVTGSGVVSPVGQDTATYWASLKAGTSGIGTPTSVPPELLQKEVVAEVKDFDPLRHFSEREIAPLDRVSQFAIVAAREAVAQSGISLDGGMSERTACIIGTGIGGVHTIDDSYKRLYQDKASRVYPLTVPKLMPNAPASQVSMHIGLRGPAFGIVSACSSASHAIGLAFQMVRAGIADAAVTGGAEACITLGTLKSWEALRVMAPDACRPFSRDRKGLVIGEGAAAVVLETLEAAEARGAEILGEVVGFGMSADAEDLTNPDVGGMTRAIVGCLKDAGLTPADVDYVNAHGTGTLANDQSETAALKSALGERAAAIPTSSTKSMVGHALGAAGALEFVAALMAIRDNLAPPTIGYLGPDPACDLDYVPNTAREVPIDVALSNSFAFGGLNAVLAARRFA